MLPKSCICAATNIREPRRNSRAASEKPRARLTKPAFEEMKNARILIVDDDPSTVALLEGMLSDHGFTNVLSTIDPRRVVAHCREFQPDLILLDLKMPYLHGATLLRRIADVSRGKAVPPVLVITADSSAETRWLTLEIGATAFLTKPFDHQTAWLQIAALLQIRQEQLADGLPVSLLPVR